MRVIPFRASLPRAESNEDPRAATRRKLSVLLLGRGILVPLPSIGDLLSATLALAAGTRRKSLLPLASAPAELVLLRRGPAVLVSYYLVDGTPDVLALDRRVTLRRLLDELAGLAVEWGRSDSDPVSRDLVLRLAERARSAPIVEEGAIPRAVLKRGGAEAPSGTALAFGFEASIVPGLDAPRETSAHADVHALLFSGRVSLFTRNRRVGVVADGPIMLAVSRMVTAVRALVDAFERGRPLNIRLRAGTFSVEVRCDLSGDDEPKVRLTLSSEDGPVRIPNLTIAQASLPILRLASELTRALIAVDRSQARNLRVSSLREEVRALRRRIRDRGPEVSSIVNHDPEILRAASGLDKARPAARKLAAAPRALRFEPRWEADIDGLDSASTFLCGDRIVVATPQHAVALSREDARVLWVQEKPAAASFMTGTVLVRLGSDGELSLIDVNDGEAFAQGRIAPRLAGPPLGILAGGRSAPPVAVLAEQGDRLVAVDLRTGQLRWRYQAGRPGSFGLRKSGRILVFTTGGSTVSALDVASGELLWRFAKKNARFTLPPAVDADMVFAAEGNALHGIDLFSGRSVFSAPLDEAPVSAPVAGSELVTLAVGAGTDARLRAFDRADGRRRFSVTDPGAAQGAACLSIDRTLLFNAPTGRLVALSADDGSTRWDRTLAHPVADDVPRRLEPVLRGGALFVPSANVHVVRPTDGRSIGGPLPCDLIPDWMRVDERGWVYVAEESGQLTALAPRPHLELVK